MTATVGNLTHVWGYVKERQAVVASSQCPARPLRSRVPGVHKTCGETTLAPLTGDRCTPLELRELQKAAVSGCGWRRLLPVAERSEGGHEPIEIHAITHRCLLDGMFFVNGT